MHVLGVLIHVLGVGVGNDIRNVQGCVCVCAINFVLGGGRSV